MSFDDFLQRKVDAAISQSMSELMSRAKRSSQKSYYGEIIDLVEGNLYNVRMEDQSVVQAKAGGNRVLGPGTGVFVVNGQIQ